MKFCEKKSCAFYYLTLFANVALIIMVFLMVANAYGQNKYIGLLIALPPLLSIIALRKGGDKEERTLKARIRKAQLRKELEELKAFDKEGV